MKKALTIVLLSALSLQAQAFFQRDKETLELTIEARTQCAGSLRGFNQFYFDNIVIKDRAPGLDSAAFENSLQLGLWGQVSERVYKKACPDRALVKLEIDKRDLAANGDLDYAATAEIALMVCK